MAQRKNDRKIDFKYNLSVYWSFLSKYKLILFSILLVVLINETAFLSERFLFKILIDKGTEFAGGTVLAKEFIHILTLIAAVFVSALSIAILTNWLKIHLVNRIEVKMILDLKRKFFNHLLTLDYNFHITHKTGSMISRLIRGGGAIERITDVLVFNFLTILFQLIVVTFSLVYLDITSAIVIFAITVSFIYYSMFIQKYQQVAGLEENQKEDIEKGNISDIFTNIDSIKYFGKEDLIRNKYKSLSDDTRTASLKHWDFHRWTASGQSLILAVGTFALIFLSVRKVLNGEMTLGTLAFVYTVYSSLIGQMFGFVHGIRGFYRSMADFQDLFEYGKIQREVKDKSNAKNLEVSSGSVEFRNVSFHYGRKKAFSLNDFSLEIKPNEKVALVGHSGCGKSTLVKLLYRFFDVQKGEILVDGKNIRDFKQESVRGELSIVPQECVLFDDTIYNNIAFANPKATKKEVMDAIRFAQLDKIVENFPQKEKTIVGERGVKLSGGEKQRVSIARAILANKKILVLDEATSALDSETEHEIQRNLEKLLQGRTSIIIAHRLSTIMSADRIIVMKQGKIIQEGTHNDLIKKPGEYKKLWNLQKGGYIK